MNDPTFKSVFGKSWDDLPPVMKKHYANHPYSDDEVIVEGKMDVACKPPLKWMGFLMKWTGQIPACNEKDIPVTVKFQSDQKSKSFYFDRIFYFKNKKPYHFRSRMLQVNDNEVIEIMRFGLTWKMLYSWDGEKVRLDHKGYAFNLLGILIPLPLTFLMGKAFAEEIPVDENSFDMMVRIIHPWWGKVYEYKGRFEVISEA